ncbi:MAG TPA: hypothetical protein VFM64_03520 [Candidatus Nitrosotenuis sp.]|nr:hypothetical protein [Candidatus Nitrosotenuis sp.]
MSWRKIAMKFPGTCIVCNQKIEANEIGLWAQGLGVKHEKCATSEVKELKCIVCGGPAGCQKCEFFDDCDRESVSELCICKKCEDAGNTYEAYKDAVKKKYALLNLKAD